MNFMACRCVEVDICEPRGNGTVRIYENQSLASKRGFWTLYREDEDALMQAVADFYDRDALSTVMQSLVETGHKVLLIEDNGQKTYLGKALSREEGR